MPIHTQIRSLHYLIPIRNLSLVTFKLWLSLTNARTFCTGSACTRKHKRTYTDNTISIKPVDLLSTSETPVYQEEATQFSICISSTTLCYKMKLLQSNITQPSINCCIVFFLGCFILNACYKTKALNHRLNFNQIYLPSISWAG